MAQLTYNSVRKFRYCDEPEEVERVETLRDALLKRFLSKQLSTGLSIDECVSNQSKFVSGTKQEDIGVCTKGILSIEKFKKKCGERELREILLSCGLGDDEAEFLLSRCDSRGKASDEAYEQRLAEIKRKLDLRQQKLADDTEEEFSSALKLNRHEYEEECKKITSTDAAELLTPCLVKLKPHCEPWIPSNHPINTLPDLEQQLFSKPSPKKEHDSPKPKRAKVEDEKRYRYYFERPKTLWDVEEQPILVLPEASKDEAVSAVENRPRHQSIKEKNDFSKPFIWPLDRSQLIPQDTINSNRVILEKLKEDPKFKNYRPGDPSATLYVKNLPHKIEPILLASLFGHFESENSGERIEYRILKGRMRGQAFIKFPCVESACKAINLCNGFVVEGKPLVIEYSKKKLN